MSEIEETIAKLSDMEKRIMNIIGRINGSPNKNFTRETVKKKASDEELPHVDSALKRFRKLKLIRYYRPPDNFATTNLGYNIAQKLREKAQEKKYGIRIIRR